MSTINFSCKKHFFCIVNIIFTFGGIILNSIVIIIVCWIHSYEENYLRSWFLPWSCSCYSSLCPQHCVSGAGEIYENFYCNDTRKICFATRFRWIALFVIIQLLVIHTAQRMEKECSDPRSFSCLIIGGTFNLLRHSF